MDNNMVPVIIPAYEPDEKLAGLIKELKDNISSPVIVVDDGSDPALFGSIFEEVRSLGVMVLTHAVNMGKGRALKTAFNYCLNEYTDLAGVVTADSDGQHSVDDIKAVSEALLEEKNSLIIGARDFSKSGVPAKSFLGNRITSRVMKILIGISVSDTQTGLRGIPADFMRTLLTEKGERYEFETNMLIASKDHGVPIREVAIETIYIDGNKSSHFNPVR
ncbi:MAG: glycosyltransferase family 2 protein, partial [Lachnospiraceae bacterium]|nr:glycosyltransferase family 2 protein [Lachnospiraceae bacterium]